MRIRSFLFFLFFVPRLLPFFSLPHTAYGGGRVPPSDGLAIPFPGFWLFPSFWTFVRFFPKIPSFSPLSLPSFLLPSRSLFSEFRSWKVFWFSLAANGHRLLYSRISMSLPGLASSLLGGFFFAHYLAKTLEYEAHFLLHRWILEFSQVFSYSWSPLKSPPRVSKCPFFERSLYAWLALSEIPPFFEWTNLFSTHKLMSS